MIALPTKHVVIALRVVGCDADAVVLQSVLAVANGAGMTHAAIQRDPASEQWVEADETGASDEASPLI